LLLNALTAYVQLMTFDWYLSRGQFAVLCKKVREYPVRHTVKHLQSIDEICHAVNLACIWYVKQVLCLQRSAATVCLLKKRGFAATLVVGAQQMPFKAHAWVEMEGRVVNDKPYVPEIYAVLDRY
jgi:hypothetical protein